MWTTGFPLHCLCECVYASEGKIDKNVCMNALMNLCMYPYVYHCVFVCMYISVPLQSVRGLLHHKLIRCVCEKVYIYIHTHTQVYKYGDGGIVHSVEGATFSLNSIVFI